MNIQIDRIHLKISIPPKLSISQLWGKFKVKNRNQIFADTITLEEVK